MPEFIRKIKPSTSRGARLAGPAWVRSWHRLRLIRYRSSPLRILVLEVLPEVISRIDYPALMEELVGRSHAARARLAYLVSGVTPELADRLDVAAAGRVWFGPRVQIVRNNARWNISDTILPVAPIDLTPR